MISRKNMLLKFAQIAKAEKGVESQVLLQKWRPVLEDLLKRVYGELPKYSLVFQKNMEEIGMFGGEVHQVGNKMKLQLNGINPEVGVDKLKRELIAIFHPTQDLINRGLAIFAFDIYLDGKLFYRWELGK